ncbi:hypothetical protein ASZ90_003318 [hydrocarbon metagenome]|uniref:Uncharacterized protein n=1 Tax=hydrocarbon metagenome TaxID=938273 RepID=A0A0W8G0Z2_9ZZZZ
MKQIIIRYVKIFFIFPPVKFVVRLLVKNTLSLTKKEIKFL